MKTILFRGILPCKTAAEGFILRPKCESAESPQAVVRNLNPLPPDGSEPGEFRPAIKLASSGS